MTADSFPFDRSVASEAATGAATVRERPILFSGAMVRALLAGTKTQTRRALRVQPDAHHWESIPGYELKRSKVVTINERCAVKFSHSIPQNRQWDTALDWLLCPYGQPGDRLWVKETHARNEDQLSETRINTAYMYRADGEQRALDNGCEKPWTPSIHMPRWASRILLEVTDVRVERLQQINEADAAAEGCDPASFGGITALDNYATLWNTINGTGSWAANPWVWVVEFRRLTPGSQADTAGPAQMIPNPEPLQAARRKPNDGHRIS